MVFVSVRRYLPCQDRTLRERLEFIAKNDLIIINPPNSEPTFRRENAKGWPDVTIATRKVCHDIDNWKVQELDIGSDHATITFRIKGRFPHKSVSTTCSKGFVGLTVTTPRRSMSSRRANYRVHLDLGDCREGLLCHESSCHHQRVIGLQKTSPVPPLERLSSNPLSFVVFVKDTGQVYLPRAGKKCLQTFTRFAY
ncbi:hypothetical protein CDAR_390981 [Caerostris darwini]|uniref:Endonuclease/exonuclease/phosphatase domain-containing protein n=1 Tax=Caerostris darwini TaxID=1538125 RepID=A0AAV4UAE1_9ARAC|nr:hypothetical protein CDAR_390981 [Caerostris darwini]